VSGHMFVTIKGQLQRLTNLPQEQQQALLVRADTVTFLDGAGALQGRGALVHCVGADKWHHDGKPAADADMPDVLDTADGHKWARPGGKRNKGVGAGRAQWRQDVPDEPKPPKPQKKGV
jgi:hypothetical protein